MSEISIQNNNSGAAGMVAMSWKEKFERLFKSSNKGDFIIAMSIFAKNNGNQDYLQKVWRESEHKWKGIDFYFDNMNIVFWYSKEYPPNIYPSTADPTLDKELIDFRTKKEQNEQSI